MISTGSGLASGSESPLLSSTIFIEKPNQPIPTSSATRYQFNSPEEVSPRQLPPKTCEIPNRRKSSHHRQRSIYIASDVNIESPMHYLRPRESSVHIYNPSDTDSVIYLGPGDCTSLNSSTRQDYIEGKAELQLSSVETASGSILSIEKDSISKKGEPIQSLGEQSVAVYCRYCKEDVHTDVDFNSCYSSKILNALSSVIGCCKYPNWLAEYRVHKCPRCSLVLGKSR